MTGWNAYFTPGQWLLIEQVRLRCDPSRRYAHWQAGEHAFCAWCNQKTPELYVVPLPGPMPAAAVCRVCALRAMRDERQQH